MGEGTTFSEEELQRLKLLAAKAKPIIDMEESFQRAGWLGRLLWKVALTVGATIGGLAWFKDTVVALFTFKTGG